MSSQLQKEVIKAVIIGVETNRKATPANNEHGRRLDRIIISKTIKEFASYASDPDNAPEWYVNINFALSQEDRIIFITAIKTERSIVGIEVCQFSRTSSC